jgi:threonine synthase
VGWLGARDARREFDGPIVVLATAHPAKFREVIEPVIDASVELPESLRACIELPTRSSPMAADFARFRDWLVSASLENDDA